MNDKTKLLEELSQISDYHLLSQKKKIRKLLYEMKNNGGEIKGYKNNLVNIDDYIDKILSLPNTRENVFLKLLVSISMDEQSAFKVGDNFQGNDKIDCSYDHVMEKAILFNRLFSKSRNLPGCYDCGTIGRSIFITYKNLICYNLTPEDKKRISNDYSFKNDSLKRFFELKTSLENLKENNIYICSVSLPEEIGHIWIIEKIKDKGYRIFQSSLNEYLLIDYMKFMNYTENKYLSWSEINSFLNKLKQLIESTSWNKTTIDTYYSIFYHTPEIPKESSYKFEFMFAVLCNDGNNCNCNCPTGKCIEFDLKRK